MKTFLQLVEEEKSHSPAVMAFGRMNPPTVGHMKLIDKVRSVADKKNADHVVVVSHSQDSKKNPLSSEQKLHHLKRFSSDTNFDASSKEHPSIFHHATKLYNKGHDELNVVAGSDRVKEFHDSLHKYNGVEGKHGYYNFKKINVISAGHRDPDAEGTEGMSASKMREHAKNNDFSSFRQGVPSHISDHHTRRLMNDVRKGMGLNEDVNRGKFKAIFVTGGPGSGKDIVIREAISESRATELNLIQASNYLYDKQKLSENSDDFKLQAIRNRNPLIINGPADDIEKISYIKEELEELGYETLMIFVNTTDEISKKRNSSLSKMMSESIRHDKWIKTQKNSNVYSKMFLDFNTFDNSLDKEYTEECITDLYEKINTFLECSTVNDTSITWLNENKDSKTIQGKNLRTKRCSNHIFLADNNCPVCQMLRISGKQDDVKYGDVKSNPGSYTFRTYEQSQPTLKISAPPKESKFSMDKDKEKRLKKGNTSLSASRVTKPDGIGATFSTRTSGQGLTGGAGLGNPLSSESVEYSNANPASTAFPGGGLVDPMKVDREKYIEKTSFTKIRKKLKEFNGFQNDVESGLGGTLSGSGNKEGMDSYKDVTRNIGIVIKKKNNKDKK
jgi:cytidyltransferase-like protein